MPAAPTRRSWRSRNITDAESIKLSGPRQSFVWVGHVRLRRVARSQMPSAAPHQAEMECAPAQAGGACPPVVADGPGDALSSACAGLSNDYLNHYSEALMLIEMAADDPAIGADLAEWRPVS